MAVRIPSFPTSASLSVKGVSPQHVHAVYVRGTGD